MSDCHSCGGGCSIAVAPPPAKARKATRPHVVAIIGPPNSGKSTLFNRLTGLRQKVANFPGVTVEQRIGRARTKSDREIILVDLPGVYSLTPRSEDEQVTHDVLKGVMKDVPKPDSVLLILDSTNLGRHLVLAAPILSLKLPTLVILNMADDLSSRGGQVDTSELASELGAPVALISAARGDGVEKVFQFMEGTSGRNRFSCASEDRIASPAGYPALPSMGAKSGSRRGLPGPDTALMDPPSGCDFPASCSRPADLPRRRRRRLPNHLPHRETAH